MTYLRIGYRDERSDPAVAEREIAAESERACQRSGDIADDDRDRHPLLRAKSDNRNSEQWEAGSTGAEGTSSLPRSSFIACALTCPDLQKLGPQSLAQFKSKPQMNKSFRLASAGGRLAWRHKPLLASP